MAAAYERMGAGFYCYFYADNAIGTTLLAFDPSGCGYCAFPNGKPRLTSQKTGGTFCGEDGYIIRSWSSLKPLRANEPIHFDLSTNIKISFQSRQLIHATLQCQGLTQEYDLGDVPKMANDSYLGKVVHQIKMGPERGKYVLDVDKCRQAAVENRERREAMAMKELDVAKTHITEDDMQKHPQLRPIVTSTSDLQSSVKRGDWNVDVFISKQKMVDTLNSSFPTLGMSMAGTLKMDPAVKTLSSLPATKPDVLQELLKESGLESGALPLSNAIKSASGRYRPDHGVHYRTPRRRLKELKAKTFDEYIKHEAPKTTLVVVCCGAGWLPQWRRTEPILEMLNGELSDGFDGSYDATGGGASSSGAGAGGGGDMPNFILRKFDMSESRFLRDRYNINTLPMYLMYYGGKLVYASSTLNGYGTSKADLVAQIKESITMATRGSFLPDTFKFGDTDNKTTAKFSETLGATAPILGKE